MALIAESGPEKHEFGFDPREKGQLSDQFQRMTKGKEITKVAVATGPGSFTGLRLGVSFGLGLAIGLRVPIVPLPTLAIQAARSDDPVLAVSEAGRGRIYYLPPGGQPSIGDPAELPTHHDVVGWLRPQTHRSLLAAGLHFRPEAELRSFAEAAAIILKTAREVPYGSLEIEYMQSFTAAR